MGCTTKISKPSSELCLGDLNQQIDILARAITVPDLSGVDYGEAFTQIITIWASVETKTGVQIFDGTNLVGTATHIIYVRYIPNVTFEDWVLLKGQYYAILSVENINEDDQFLKLSCVLRGDQTKPINYSR